MRSQPPAIAPAPLPVALVLLNVLDSDTAIVQRHTFCRKFTTSVGIQSRNDDFFQLDLHVLLLVSTSTVNVVNWKVSQHACDKKCAALIAVSIP